MVSASQNHDETEPRQDGRLARGDRTRADILSRAVDVASVDGLDGLTIGRLATDLEMSKSGLIRHFGSKEELQLATVGAAGERFAEVVLGGALGLKPGMDRLDAIVSAWLDYLVSDTFAGGCFFYATAPEVDRQPGRVRDAVGGAVRAGIDLMREDIIAAQSAGDLDSKADPKQIVFEIHAQIQEANLWHLLLEDPDAIGRSRQSLDTTLKRYRQRS
jgi:AcrR family transcriptional regulator